MTDDGDDGDGQWRYGVDDVGDAAETGGAGREANAGTGEGVMGSTDAAAPDPEPGSPTAENAFFVVLGSLTVIAIVALLLF